MPLLTNNTTYAKMYISLGELSEMVLSTESFTYQHADRYGNPRQSPVMVEPMGPEYLAWRLRISKAEAEDLQAQRQERQKERLSHFVGEYVIDGLGYSDSGLQEAHIGAVVAHRKALDLGEQVYGGYRGMNFLRHGTLFGSHSNEAATKIEERNTFCAAQVDNWRVQAGYAKNNPFDHMTRGDEPSQRAPILAAFAVELLQAGSHEARIDCDTYLWTPKDELKIEGTVQVVYHRGKI